MDLAPVYLVLSRQSYLCTQVLKVICVTRWRDSTYKIFFLFIALFVHLDNNISRVYAEMVLNKYKFLLLTYGLMLGSTL